MSNLQYMKGDATCPQGKGVKIICHICSNRGGWGKGFVLAISKRWEEPATRYRAWHRNRAKNDFELGAVQFIQVEPYIWVANMIGQHGMKPSSAGPPIRYEALDQCLFQVAAKAQELGASIHMPRIGCELAGGDWSRIEPIIKSQLCDQGLSVTVYDFD